MSILVDWQDAQFMLGIPRLHWWTQCVYNDLSPDDTGLQWWRLRLFSCETRQSFLFWSIQLIQVHYCLVNIKLLNMLFCFIILKPTATWLLLDTPVSSIWWKYIQMMAYHNANCTFLCILWEYSWPFGRWS